MATCHIQDRCNSFEKDTIKISKRTKMKLFLIVILLLKVISGNSQSNEKIEAIRDLIGIQEKNVIMKLSDLTNNPLNANNQ